MDHQLNFTQSSLFNVSKTANKTVHPAIIISAFYGCPVSPENKIELIDFLNFLLDTSLPDDFSTTALIQRQCNKIAVSLKNTFPEMHLFSCRHAMAFFECFKNGKDTSIFISHIEQRFGNKLTILKVVSADALQGNAKQQKTSQIYPFDELQDKVKQQKFDFSDPIDNLFKAYCSVQTFGYPRPSIPSWLPNEPKTTHLPVAKL